MPDETVRLWDFRCVAERLPDGKYRVTITGTKSGEVRTRIGCVPLWDLIRLLKRRNDEISDVYEQGGAS